MAKTKYFIFGACALFATIGYMGYRKKEVKPEEIASSKEVVQEIVIAPKVTPVVVETPVTQVLSDAPDVDRISQLFTLDSSKLPIVETISYTSRVPWLKGRPAWISDYASHYETSRHFIARSLNKKADYFTQKVGPGDRFNIFKKDAKIQFHLLIDLAKSKMRFYYVDLNTNERTLLKTYKVGLGRADSQKKSGYLTPLGKYELGNRIAIYKPGTMGFFQDKKTEMVRVFGTRWIPFEKELDGCSEPARGFGLHGTPWLPDAQGNLVEDRTKIGKYDSDGCVRLLQEDIEELFAIIITKPTTVELVRSFDEAKLPGVEK